MDQVPSSASNRRSWVMLISLLGAGAILGYGIIRGLKNSGLLSMEWDLTSIQVVTLIPLLLLCILGVVAIHELGHLLMGLVQGFRFQMYVVGPFGIKREEETEHIKIYLNKDLNVAGGLAATTPTRDDPANIYKFARIVLAGPLSSLLLGLGLLAGAAYFTPFWSLILSFGGFFSVVIFLVTIIPFGSSTFMSDGKRFVRLVLGSPKEKNIEMALMRTTAIYTQSRRYDLLDLADIELIKTDTAPLMRTVGYFYAFLHHYSKGNLEQAEAEKSVYLKRAQELPKGLIRMLDKEILRVKHAQEEGGGTPPTAI